MRKQSKMIYDGGDWKLTVNELLFSVAIILIMLTLGFFISEKIASANDEANQEYYQAIKISGDAELFQYGMRTNVGNAFVYGTLEAVGPVTYPEIDGEYAYITKIEEEYTKHYRTVTDYDKDGNKVDTHTETYWEWDEIGRETIHCSGIQFLGVDFAYGVIDFPSANYIATVKQSMDIRYIYYGCNTSYEGTIYAKLENNTITSVKFMNGMEMDEAVEHMVNSGVLGIVLFWFAWIILIGSAVFGFCYMDNKWLEDN